MSSPETSDNLLCSAKDLPMSANLQDITVKHFVLDLACKMEERVLDGSITLFCCPSVNEREGTNRDNFQSSTSGNIALKTPACVHRRSEERIQCNSEPNQEPKCSERPTFSVKADTFQYVGMDDCEIPTPEQCKSVDQPAAGTGEIAENSGRVCGSVDVCHSCSNPDSVKSVDENVISSSEKKPSDSHHHMVCSAARDKYENIQMSHHSSQQLSGENSTDLDVRSTNQSCHVVAAEANVTAQTMFVNCSEVRSRCVPEESSVARQEQLSPCATIQHSAGLCHPSQHLESIKESRPFKMILDSYKLQIHKVEGMFLHGEEKLLFEKNPEEFLKKTSVKDFVFQNGYQWHMMDFVVKEHCILVSMETVHTVEQFPHAVRIWYQTCPESPSLMWTTDQDGNACVFTIGHFLSNRALFPSQDTPTALPTWHANITVDGDLTTLLTGDREPLITVTGAGQKRFSYFTTFPMPSCTFAIAIGAWQTEVLSYPPFDYDPDQENLKEPTLRLFFPERLKERSTSVLSRYLPRCLLEAQRMLGTYPFHRLDVLIVPACFDSLGMASPSLLFLSQSLLCQDGSMCVRVAHELCHTWFGIVIGPHDWTEEWITEGFCTYLEDILHAKVSQLGEQTEDYIKVRAQIHLSVLKAELLNTDENLQSLRPNKGMADATECTSEQARYLKDGMNVEKKFMQVHYLKGYFLLQSLEREVGKVRFLAFLKSYVQRYIYQLVTSQDFLKMYFETFPDLTHISVDTINRQWLDSPGMPESLSDSEDTYSRNVLSAHVNEELSLVLGACRSSTGRKRRRGRQPKRHLPTLDQMVAPQVVLLFDRLLEEKKVPGHVLDLLKRVHHSHLDNAEVCHRWCELVVKHRHKKCYPDVERFLINHQAMGVYLYGEAMISECPDVIQLARTCFRQLRYDMPESVRETVSAMLYA